MSCYGIEEKSQEVDLGLEPASTLGSTLSKCKVRILLFIRVTEGICQLL
jgi:hypothetical protein